MKNLLENYMEHVNSSYDFINFLLECDSKKHYHYSDYDFTVQEFFIMYLSKGYLSTLTIHTSVEQCLNYIIII